MGLAQLQKVRVRALAGVVPPECVDIRSELDTLFGGDSRQLERYIKIMRLGSRRIASPTTTNLMLCHAAAARVLDYLQKESGAGESAGGTIDALILSSTSLDYKYPASACILQGYLGLPEDCTCLDMTGLGCSAFVHALLLGSSLIQSGAARRCLVVAGDTNSRHTNPRNKNTRILFGDGAAAALLERDEEAGPSYFLTGTRGKDYELLIAPAGGAALPLDHELLDLELRDKAGNVWHLWEDVMQGMEIFRFSTEIAAWGIERLLKAAGVEREEVDYYALHQANGQIVKAVAAVAALPKGRYSAETFERYGNCGNAAVALDLCRELQQRQHDRVCLATFGVGLSWGLSLLDTSKTRSLGISDYEATLPEPTRAELIEHYCSLFVGKVGQS